MTSSYYHDSPDVLIKPPQIYFFFLILALGLNFFKPLPFITDPLRFQIGAALCGIGFVFIFGSLAQLASLKTSMTLSGATTRLATNGLYGLCRHPFYAGLTLTFSGTGFLLDSLWFIFLLVPMMILIRICVISLEESYLEIKFGEVYRNYKSHIPSWF